VEQEAVTLRELIEQWQEQHNEVHKSERLERDLAVRVQDGRLEMMNEFRAQINSERGEYVTRKELETWVSRVQKLERESITNQELDAVSARLIKAEKTLDRTAGYAAAMLFMFTVITAIIGLAVRFL
jgi:hypothetical protein